MAAPQPPTAPPHRSRGFSVKSEQSHRSSTSGHKSHLSESSQEKAKRNLHTKADPLVAMNELQPMAVALEQGTIGSLRDIQHKDQFGNPITDPDWSNPTRPRFERPLDTIRSFEAAIYGTYNSTRPNSYARTGSLGSTFTSTPGPQSNQFPVDDAASQMGDFSRRTSTYGPNPYANRGYSEQNAHYGRSGPSRPDSMIDAYGSQAPDNYYPPSNQNGGRRPRGAARMSSDQNHGYGYQQQNYQRSYDNVTAMSGSGSGYTDPSGQSTDPSSLNSSMDQLQQAALQQQRLDERAQAEYGFQGFNAGPNLHGKGMPSAPAPTADPNWGGGSPSGSQAPRRTPVAAPPKPPAEKRKSWFKKRFSKD
ncbi:hypothetical protein N7462_001988 [Penicillium macrosclerotiorum]|uniref:uncharacterized protein n=1 Tax=Penicillium macrosclerotiorum TaxID=303699 RepID=UPI0025493B7A|nr:uncharacterized protein N7462_001988 [Penicillium macrosclerotiorum]KAJ5692565.1 hypothetical protein N7462_001988 [Penicillium macrosclerotiorum]